MTVTDREPDAPAASELFESIAGPIPGPRSLELGRELRRLEARGVTRIARDFPVFWASARGATVTDADGNRFLDLTAAFGVAAAGHSNARTAAAIAAQAERLIHGMGDVHPTEVRLRLMARLAELAPGDLTQVFLASTGAEAVEFALKTARLASGRRGVLAFDGAYHGLSYGTLEVIGIEKFRRPFADQLAGHVRRAPYGAAEAVRALLERDPEIGAVIVEPIAGRAGTIVPPPGFLRALRTLCDRHGAVLIADEIYTGFGRTGAWFACDHEAVVPDILCAGKALAGGYPLSAAVGRRAVFDAWPPSEGEALHTSTYLGNPLGCAAALANLEEIERLDLVARARELEGPLRARLHALAAAAEYGIRDVRGRGAMWALELADGARATRAVTRALARGLILLQQGTAGNVLGITPPLVIGDAQLERALDLLESALA
jgi:4-aminobutyrate aminotransferase-like enzyme